jgi:hypothetical protein
MRTHLTTRFLSAAASIVTALLVTVPAQSAVAQGAPVDPRWQAWLGCWEAADASGVRIIGSTSAPIVCAIPAAGASAVDLVTVVSGKIVDRMLVEANGQRRTTTKDGCTGWESAAWSKSASRVYLHSEYSCPGGVTRNSNGLLALSPRGEWLDVQSVASGTNKGVRVVRMNQATDLTNVPAEVTTALQGRSLSANAARVAASATLTAADLIDATTNVDAPVVEAWLVERDQGFALDAKMLTSLADAGLPESVIDVMVALTYPKVFALNPATRTGEFRPAEPSGASYNRSRSLAVLGYDPMGYPMFGYGSYYSRCSSPYYGYYSYGYSSYLSGCGYNGYGYSGYGYGYGGYGYGFGFGYGGWYPGSVPVVVVVRGEDNGSAGARPRVVKGRGYTAGSSGSSGSPSSGSSGSSSSSGSSGSSSSGSTSSGSGSASTPPRTAKSKP